MLDNQNDMVVINLSRSAMRRAIARLSATFVILIGFFAIFFATAPRTPGSPGASSGFSIVESAYADAPYTNYVDPSTGVYAGGDSGCGCDGAGGGAGCDSGGGGDSGGGSLICTELLRQGRMTPEWYEADNRFARLVPDNVRAGYQFWARPVVTVMQRSPLFTKFIELVAQPWAQHMAYEMGVADQDSRFGALVMQTGVPICGAIGRVVVFFGGSRIGPSYIG